MRIPLSWLQEFVRVPVEPKKLADDLPFIGFEVASLETDGRDTVLDLEITTNRVDCMNVYGMAREIAVLYEQPLGSLDVTFAESPKSGPLPLDVTIEAPELCPRFCARVLDVTVAPSPAWLRDRLEQVGVRPINNVVDLTNYVMMEMGQPTHAFDLQRIMGQRLIARFAFPEERLKTLDGEQRTLSPRTGVVAGDAGPLALAGIMGGAESEVTDATRMVALEAANWDPLIVRRAAKALAVHTEAAHRFERGADPEAPPVAVARIAHLLGKIGAGAARAGLLDRVGRPFAKRRVFLRQAQIQRVLGTEVPGPAVRRILAGLGFTPSGEDSRLEVAIPSWRGDVAREVDLIEEVARHHGLDRIAPALPPGKRVEGFRPWQVREGRLRDLLAGCGLSEVINYAFVREASTSEVAGAGVALLNPLSEDQAVLRRSLVIPGLLGTLQTNLRLGRRDVRIFELGRVFSDDRPLPREERRLGVLLHGDSGEAHWSQKSRPTDFFDAKGIVEIIGHRLEAGLTLDREGVPSFLHPGQSALVKLGPRAIGWIGTLHPDTAERWELREAPVVLELAIGDILAAEPPARRFQPLARFPSVSRDLSLFLDEDREVVSLEREIVAAAGPLLQSVEVLELYRGVPIPTGKVGLSLALTYQHPTRTLIGEEVQRSVDEVVAVLARSGATLRGVTNHG